MLDIVSLLSAARATPNVLLVTFYIWVEQSRDKVWPDREVRTMSP